MNQCQISRPEAVAAPKDCLDISLPAFAFSQSPPHQGHVLGQTAFLDERVRPESFHQRVLFQNPPLAFKQLQEGFVGFGSERHNLIAPQQEALGGIDPERAKFIETPGFRGSIRS